MYVKQPKAVITFHSTADALAMERRAKELAIPGRMIPTPADIVATCGLSWMVERSQAEEVETLLGRYSIAYEAVRQVTL